MALYPAAVKRLIPPGPNDPRITARVAILHVDSGNTRDLHDYFNGPSGGVESHFNIALDGTVFQYRDTAYQADANCDANDFAISIETQGYGAGEWTPEQLASIKALLTWLHATHSIPLVKCPKWDGSGVGYHILFMQQWAGGPRSCPGPDRVKQFDSVLVPWMASGTPAPEKDWFDMATAAELKQIVHDEVNSPEYLKNVARFVLTGLQVGPAGQEKVLAGYLTTLEALIRLGITADTDDLTKEDARAALSEILAGKVQINIVAGE